LEIRFVRQHLYQCCVRNEPYKVVGLNGAVFMRRFQTWRDKLERLSRGVGRRLGIPQEAKPVAVDEGASCDRLYWVDLEADPDEARPRSWGEVPAAVLQLRDALDALYRGAVRGPALDAEEGEKAAVLERLAALGYVDL
jgi:hypothetical protein